MSRSLALSLWLGFLINWLQTLGLPSLWALVFVSLQWPLALWFRDWLWQKEWIEDQSIFFREAHNPHWILYFGKVFPSNKKLRDRLQSLLRVTERQQVLRVSIVVIIFLLANIVVITQSPVLEFHPIYLYHLAVVVILLASIYRAQLSLLVLLNQSLSFVLFALSDWQAIAFLFCSMFSNFFSMGILSAKPNFADQWSFTKLRLKNSLGLSSILVLALFLLPEIEPTPTAASVTVKGSESEENTTENWANKWASWYYSNIEAEDSPQELLASPNGAGEGKAKVGGEESPPSTTSTASKHWTAPTPAPSMEPEKWLELMDSMQVSDGSRESLRKLNLGRETIGSSEVMSYSGLGSGGYGPQDLLARSQAGIRLDESSLEDLQRQRAELSSLFGGAQGTATNLPEEYQTPIGTDMDSLRDQELVASENLANQEAWQSLTAQEQREFLSRLQDFDRAIASEIANRQQMTPQQLADLHSGQQALQRDLLQAQTAARGGAAGDAAVASGTGDTRAGGETSTATSAAVTRAQPQTTDTSLDSVETGEPVVNRKQKEEELVERLEQILGALRFFLFIGLGLGLGYFVLQYLARDVDPERLRDGGFKEKQHRQAQRKFVSLLQRLQRQSIQNDKDILLAYSLALQALEQTGRGRPQWQPATDFAIDQQQAGEIYASAFREMTEFFCRVQYGKQVLDSKERQMFIERQQEFSRQLQQLPRM